MISAQTLRVCREGKPLHTFPDHALTAHNKATRDRIMSDAFERFRFSFFEDQNSARDGLDLSSLAQLSDDERVRAEDMLIAYLPDTPGGDRARRAACAARGARAHAAV
jgi:hypothetical protein